MGMSKKEKFTEKDWAKLNCLAEEKSSIYTARQFLTRLNKIVDATFANSRNGSKKQETE